MAKKNIEKKKLTKVLYVNSIKEMPFEEAQKEPEFKSYSSGKAVFRNTCETVEEWIETIFMVDLMTSGFGMMYLGEDGRCITLDMEVSEYMVKKNRSEAFKMFEKIIVEYNNPKTDYYYRIFNNGLYASTERTGHRNFGSPYECSDTCATCDGAKCDTCRDRITVYDYTGVLYKGYDKEKATEIYKAHEIDYSEELKELVKEYPSKLRYDIGTTMRSVNCVMDDLGLLCESYTPRK